MELPDSLTMRVAEDTEMSKNNESKLAQQSESHTTDADDAVTKSVPSSALQGQIVMSSTPKRKWRLNLWKGRYSDCDSDSLVIPSLPHSSKRESNHRHRNGKAANKASRYILMGRTLFILCLALAAALLSYLSWRFLTESERKLANSHFDSLAERALAEASGVFRAKRWSTISLASIMSEIHPNPDSWPFVTVPGYGRISEHLLTTTDSQEVAVMPLVSPERLAEWEAYMFDFYQRQQVDVSLAQWYGGTWEITTGGCVWGMNPIDCYDFDSRRDLGPNMTTWEFKNILAPMSQASRNFQDFLMYNVHSHPPHARAIDRAIDCIEETALANQDKDDKDLQQVLDYGCATLPRFIHIPTFIDAGPSSIMFQPIRVGSDRDPKVRKADEKLNHK